MLKKVFTFAALLHPLYCHADLYQAIQAYKSQNYVEAKAEFEQLVDSGNSGAAYFLALMALHTEAEQQDLVRAYAYFSLAVHLGEQSALNDMHRLEAELSESQKQQAADLYHQLQKHSLPGYTANEFEQPAWDNVRQRLKTVEPQYPQTLARQGLPGFTKSRFVVDKAGNVVYVKTIYSVPEDSSFAKVTENALMEWKFGQASDISLHKIQIDFIITGAAKDFPHLEKERKSSMVKALAESDWKAAFAGRAVSQLNTATLLSYLMNERNFYAVSGAAVVTPPTMADIDSIAYVKPGQGRKMPAFPGKALVQVNADQKIEKIESNLTPLPLAKGQSLPDLEPRYYRISPFNLHHGTQKPPLFAEDQMYLEALIAVPAEWTPTFWLDQAARNGVLAAQRARALDQPYWSEYLKRKNDADALGWYAIELLSENKLAEARIALATAKSAGFESTRALDALFQ